MSKTTGRRPLIAQHPEGGATMHLMPATYTSIHFHVVFATKDRQALIAPDWKGRLHAYLGGTANGLGVMPLEVGGVDDHVHMLLGLKATQAISDVVRELKKSSNTWVRDQIGMSEFSWQVGYAALSESACRIQQLRNYIQNQEEHHRRLSSREELLELLKEASIEPDMRFFE